MPQLPVSTDFGPSPGGAGIVDVRQEAVRRFQVAQTTARASEAMFALGNTVGQGAMRLRQIEVRSEIDTETLQAREAFLTREAEIRQEVLAADIHPDEMVPAFQARVGKVADEIEGGFRHGRSRQEFRQTALAATRDGMLTLGHAATGRRKDRFEGELFRLQDRAAREALGGDSDALDRSTQEFVGRLEMAEVMLGREATARLQADYFDRTQGILLERESDALVDAGRYGDALALTGRAEEVFDGIQPERLMRIRNRIESRVATELRRLDAAEGESQQSGVDQTINAFVAEAAALQRDREALDPQAPDFAARSAELEGRETMLELFADEVEPHLARVANREDFAALQKARKALSEVRDNPNALAMVEASFADPETSAEESGRLIRRLQGQGVLSPASANNFAAYNRSQASAEAGSAIRQARDRLESAFGRPRGGGTVGGAILVQPAAGAGQDEMANQLAAATLAFEQFVAASPGSTRQQLLLEVDRILADFDGRLPGVETLVPPPVLSEVLRAEGVRPADMTPEHIRAAGGRLAARHYEGALDERALDRAIGELFFFEQRLSLARAAHREGR